jgi:hypothetical protein
MIAIRPEQFEAFEKDRAKNYHQQLADFFRKNCPEAVRDIDNGALVQRISTLVDLSRSFGLGTPEGILGYVSLGLAAGPDFDSESNVNKFLRMPGAPPEVKIRELLRRVADRCRT